MATGFNKYEDYLKDKNYIITEDELKYWVGAGLKYLALLNGGVLGWKRYYDALDDFKNNPKDEMPQEYTNITEATIADLVKGGKIREWQ